MIRVRALGDGVVQLGRKRITLATEGIFALAFHLAVRAGERIGRDELVETFWPGSEPTNGRHALRQMMYRLRQKGFVLDEESGEELYLDPARVDCDLSAVLGEEWPETADAAAVEAAGQPTPTFTRHISERFQEWNDELRARVERQHRRAALRQIVRARREGRWSDLEVWARQVLRSDPLNEEATLARAESAAMAGSKAMALEILDQYMEELGDRAAQIGLPATVLRRRIAERKPEWPNRGPREVPLVGRAELMSKLTGLVDAAGRGEGRMVVLWGAPGVGKTRLNLEASEYARISGFLVVGVSLTPATGATPNGLAIRLAETIRNLPGAAGAPPAAMALVDRLLSHPQEPESSLVAQSGDGSADTLSWALQEVLRAVSDEQKLVVLIDDLHHADESSRNLANVIARATSDCRVAWLTTQRSRPAINQASGQLDAWHVPLAVQPLPDLDARLLAAELCATHTRSAGLDPSELARAAGGNPMFIRELVIHQTRRGPSPMLPSSLRELMDARLDSLSDGCLRLLRLVVLLGDDALLPVVARLFGPRSHQISQAVEEGEGAGIVAVSDAGHLMLHDCWRHAVNERLRGATRAALAHECAVCLQADRSVELPPDRAWRVGQLLLQAGARAEAFRVFSRCGEQMLLRGLAAQAREAFTCAVDLSDSTVDRARALCRLADAACRAGEHEESLSAARLAMDTCGSGSRAAASLYVSALSLAAHSLWRLQRAHTDVLVELATRIERPGISDAERQAACLLALRLAFNDATTSIQSDLHRVSLAATRRSGLSIEGQLASLIYNAERGTAHEVLAIDATLVDLDLGSSDEFTRVLSFRIRSHALRWIGEHERARSLAAEGFVLATRLGLPDEATGFALQLAFQHLDECDTDAAISWLRVLEDSRSYRGAPARARAMLHAKCRLQVQLGQFREAFAAYSAERAGVESDPVLKRRATDMSTLGYAAAECGSLEVAEQCLSAVIPVIDGEPPTPALDYPTEMTLRTLLATGNVAEAGRLGASYLQRRGREHDRPIVSFCSTLRSMSDLLPSSQVLQQGTSSPGSL